MIYTICDSYFKILTKFDSIRPISTSTNSRYKSIVLLLYNNITSYVTPLLQPLPTYILTCIIHILISNYTYHFKTYILHHSQSKLFWKVLYIAKKKKVFKTYILHHSLHWVNYFEGAVHSKNKIKSLNGNIHSVWR